MATGTDFPQFITLQYRKDGQTEAQFIADAQRMLNGARREFANFADEAQQQLNRAISIPRNQTGSLDLNLPELRAAAAAQDARAIAAREVANATLAAARTEQNYSQEMRETIGAAKALAAAEEQRAAGLAAQVRVSQAVQNQLNMQRSATDAVSGAALRGTTANQAVINSQRSMRQAGVQSGQQLQDMVVQIEMGTRATTIFTQQVPQLAFALSGLEGSANKTADRVGRFATFLSGPWGAAIFVATAVLAPFIARLFESGEAAKAAEIGADGLAAAQTALGGIFDAASGQIENQNELLRVNARLTAINLRADALAKESSSRETLDEARTPNRSFFELQANEFIDVAARSESNAAAIAGLFQLVEAGALSMEAAIQRTELLDVSGTGVTRQDLQQAIVDGVTARVNREAADLIDQSLDEGQLAPELRRQGGSGGASGTAAAARATADAGRDAASEWSKVAEDILRINERFDEQPRLIDQASQATRELDAIIADLSARRPANFEQMIDDARAAKDVIQDALVRPFDELQQASDRRLQIEELLVSGRQDEADALQIIWSLESRLGPLTQSRKDDVLDIVEAERQATEEIERRRELQDAYIAATKDLRGELESLFAGDGFNPRRIARQLQARITVETIFGDALSEIEEVARSGFDRTVDYLDRETTRTGEAAGELANKLTNAAGAIGGKGSFGKVRVGASKSPANDNGDPDTIVVPGPRRNSTGDLTPEAYFDLVGKRMVQPLLDGMEDIVGVQLAGTLTDALGGAIGAYLRSGPVGGVLGALQGLGVGGLDGAIAGAGQGAGVAGLLGSFGIGSSNIGASIGGAIGGLTPIPGGALIGSLAGGVLGKLDPRITATILGGPIGFALSKILGFGGDKFGTASLSGLGAAGITGSGATRREGAGTLGGSVQDSLKSIADELDAQIGDFLVSIGTVNGNFRVSTTGRDGKLKNKFGDVTDFGEDEAAARAFAVTNAIADGAIRGLSASEQRLLQANEDVEEALRDVLDFRSVFSRLKAFKDPVGAALDDLNDEFEGLIDLFTRAGASTTEFAALEELYGIERANAIREASEQMSGALRDLLSELNVGDRGLSLRDRRANALGEYDELAGRVRAGDTTAFDDFATAARTLLDIERQLFGSQSGYFDRFNEVRDITQTALTEQERLAAAASGRDNPFSDVNRPGDAPLIAAIDRGNQQVVDQMIAMNDNMGRLIALQGSAAAGRNAPRFTRFQDNF